jgi:hypothetical protein
LFSSFYFRPLRKQTHFGGYFVERLSAGQPRQRREARQSLEPVRRQNRQQRLLTRAHLRQGRDIVYGLLAQRPAIFKTPERHPTQRKRRLDRNIAFEQQIK